MISEVLNALVLTFFATEYLLANEALGVGSDPQQKASRRGQQRTFAIVLVVVLVNVVERLSTVGIVMTTALHQFAHIPKVLLAAASYTAVLFYDCRRQAPNLQVTPFLWQVGAAFLYVLPVYPCLAVLISVGFVILIHVLEFLHINPQILNWPIYYGVLYGPFSFVYWRVKETLARKRSTLPTTTSGGRVLGGA